jgi:glutamate formiminotransferase
LSPSCPSALLDIDVTPPVVVFGAVERSGRPYGVAIARSEIVGLIPERAVPARPEQTLRLTEPVESRVLERRIGEVLERG